MCKLQVPDREQESSAGVCSFPVPRRPVAQSLDFVAGVQARLSLKHFERRGSDMLCVAVIYVRESYRATGLQN